MSNQDYQRYIGHGSEERPVLKALTYLVPVCIAIAVGTYYYQQELTHMINCEIPSLFNVTPSYCKQSTIKTIKDSDGLEEFLKDAPQQAKQKKE